MTAKEEYEMIKLMVKNGMIDIMQHCDISKILNKNFNHIQHIKGLALRRC